MESELLNLILVLGVLAFLYLPIYSHQQERKKSRENKKEDSISEEQYALIQKHRNDAIANGVYSTEQRAIIESLQTRVKGVENNLLHNAYIDSAEKESILAKMKEIERKIETLLKRQNHIRRTQNLTNDKTINQESETENQVIEDRLQSISSVLEHLLTSIIDLEVDASQVKVKRLVQELSDSSQEIGDISDSFAELHHGKTAGFDTYLDEYDEK